jgi:hypothetical protein
MPTNTSALVPPPRLIDAIEEARALAAKGRTSLDAFSQGTAVDPIQVDELTAALRAGNARFREEWAECRTELPDGRMVSTPDYAAVQTILRGTGFESGRCIKWIDDNGRVVNLDLMAKNISDIAPISTLTALQGLWLDRNHGLDLAPISSLTGLQVLSLIHTQTQDLGPLSSLRVLADVFLCCNRIRDVTPLSNLPALRNLNLDDNQVEDLTPLSTQRSLRYLWVQKNPLSPASLQVLEDLLAHGVSVMR